MDNDSYRKNAYKLLAGISDRELREDANLSKIKAMIEARELFLWEINDDILRLKLFHPELMEEGEKYADSGLVNQKWFKEGEYIGCISFARYHSERKITTSILPELSVNATTYISRIFCIITRVSSTNTSHGAKRNAA